MSGSVRLQPDVRLKADATMNRSQKLGLVILLVAFVLYVFIRIR